MKVLRIDPDKPRQDLINKAVEVVSSLGIIVYPTDTVYGIGCLLEEPCVRRVYALKGRAFNSPLSVAFASVSEVRHYAEMTEEQAGRIQKGQKEGTTFILKRKEGMPDYVTVGLPTVGVRIPDSRICAALIKKTGPIITTSANPTGKKAPARFEEIDKSIINGSDLAIDGGPCKFGKPSRIIDLTSNGEILRD